MWEFEKHWFGLENMVAEHQNHLGRCYVFLSPIFRVWIILLGASHVHPVQSYHLDFNYTFY
jgi:hypothetical protein